MPNPRSNRIKNIAQKWRSRVDVDVNCSICGFMKHDTIQRMAAFALGPDSKMEFSPSVYTRPNIGADLAHASSSLESRFVAVAVHA